MNTPKYVSRMGWVRSLIGVEIALWARLEARLKRDFTMTLVVFESLWFVERSRDRSLRVGELADLLHMTIGGVSKLVDRMERAELVYREKDGHDGRASRIRLTKHGEETLRGAQDAYEDELAMVIDPILSPDERTSMHQQLRHILASVECDVARMT